MGPRVLENDAMAGTAIAEEIDLLPVVCAVNQPGLF
jgi:hypothetical protein